MIRHLRGSLVEVSPSEALVDVGGVGYQVHLAATTARRLGPTGSDVVVHIHHLIRDDHQALYGFTSRAERDCFEAILGAHGVGPALALAILSVHSPNALVRVLAEEDLEALCLVPGVGRKTAQRLVVELRARLDVEELAHASEPRAVDPAHDVAGADAASVVRLALGQLGYEAAEIREATDGLDGLDDPSIAESELVRRALRRLAPTNGAP